MNQAANQIKYEQIKAVNFIIDKNLLWLKDL